MQRTSLRQALAVILLGGISGCIVVPPGSQTKVAANDATDEASARATLKRLPPPPSPPAVPPPTPSPLDNALREKARAEIVTASRSSDPVLRANAVEAAQLGLPREEAVPIVLAGLKDNGPVVRFAGAMAAGTMRLESARPLLVGLADDPDGNVRVGARYALHKLGDTSRSRDLEQSALATDPRIRGTTAMVLGMLGEPSALRVLRPMRRDRDPNVRLQVAEAMWRLGDEEGLESLIAVTIGQYTDDQMVAIQAIAAPRNINAARPYVRGKLTTPYPAINLVAARAMGMLGSDEGYTIAIQGASSKDVRERHLAALALGAIGRSDAQPALARLLADPEPSVRLAAAVAVLQLKESM